jgi:hypothetical protein
MKKVRCKSRQMGIRKTNASEPLMRCRDLGNDIETGASMRLRDEPGGSPFTGQVVSGIEAREPGLRLLHGTWEGAR